MKYLLSIKLMDMIDAQGRVIGRKNIYYTYDGLAGHSIVHWADRALKFDSVKEAVDYAKINKLYGYTVEEYD
jgi:hypothetical protein